MASRPAQAALLRAHLRLWLTQHGTAENEVLDVLLAANEAFNNALLHSRHPQSIAVQVDAHIGRDVVEIVVRDHGQWRESDRGTEGAGLGLKLMHALMDSVDLETTRVGTTVRLRRILGRRLVAVGPSAADRERLELLGRSSIFAPQPAAMLERLAGQLIPFSASGEETIIHEGDHGGLVYLIAKGEVDVSAEQAHIATLGPGDFVGEIALLRDVPRTATIVAARPVELFALAREDFLAAVTRHQASARELESMITMRLSGLEDVLGRTPLSFA
jgi:anti-sigma regulatory factor (Ser/Thr protein kinase)